MARKQNSGDPEVREAIGQPQAEHECQACAHEDAPANLKGVLGKKPEHTCGK